MESQDPQQQKFVSFSLETRHFPVEYNQEITKYFGDGWKAKSFTTAVFRTEKSHETLYTIVVTALLERPIYAR